MIHVITCAACGGLLVHKEKEREYKLFACECISGGYVRSDTRAVPLEIAQSQQSYMQKWKEKFSA